MSLDESTVNRGLQPMNSKNAVIMMVDDEPLNMEVIRIHLEEVGYCNFLITDRSTEAIALLKEKRPDVLLLDLMMPDVTGCDILAEMQQEGLLKDIPVIVLTSSTDAATKLKVLELGATDFLSKPVDSSELVLRLQNTLAAKAYRDQLIYYDMLTGLPNRRLLLERIDRSLKQNRADCCQVGVLHIGLDRFKQINDGLGPSVGDKLLKLVARRMSECLQSSDLVDRLAEVDPRNNLARFGGDEFAIFLPRVEHIEDIAFVARRLLDSMRPGFTIAGQEIFVSPSIGIATFPGDAVDRDTLLKNAASATSYAKENGRNNYQFYSTEINARSVARMQMESRLRRALEQQEFVLHYQPKVDPYSGRVAGMEALVRWDSPDYGMVYPDRFIPLAEEGGLIVAIGNWVLREACRQQVEWHAMGLRGLSISVNLSIEQLNNQDFAAILHQAIVSTGISPDRLVLEITESLLLKDAERHIETLHALKAQGVELSIDDFGTGYSSLSYLTRLPVDELKVDRSFVVNIHSEPSHQAVGRTIIAMAQSLGLRVVAEGVEQVEHLDFLVEHGCDLIQGYYYSRPLPKSQFVQYVQAVHKGRVYLKALPRLERGSAPGI